MAFLTADNVRTVYAESKNHMRKYFDPLDEYERIARNKTSPLISKDLPQVTDGTLAAIIQEQPKRIIQDTATGIVKAPAIPGIESIATSILFDILIPLSSTSGTPLQKSWAALGKSLTYGVQPSYTFYTETNGVMHTDFILPYIKDIFLEKGKVYGPDCNVIFMRSWMTARDIQAIIDREASFKEEDPEYKTDWNIKNLKALKTIGGGGKDSDAQNPSEREEGDDTADQIEIVTGFQTGKKAKFLTFSPQAEGLLRTKKNKDPRGKMPIDFLYANIDLANPLGRGAVELSGGVQNLIDQQMSMFQFMTTMMMGPPLQVWGNVNKTRLRLAPNQIWDMGANPNNRIEPYSINNQAIANFPNNYGLLKSQILNLNSSMDTSVSAESGNPSFSKTPAGVKTQTARLSIADNYMRKQYEAWWGDVQETALNIYFAEMEGTDSIPITKEMQKDLPEELVQKYTTKDGKLEIKYEELQDVEFKFYVDASSSRIDEDEAMVEKLLQTLEVAQGIDNPVVQAGIPRLFNEILDAIGIKNADEIWPDINAPNNEPVQIEQAKIQNSGNVPGVPTGQQAPQAPQAPPQAPQQAPQAQEAPLSEDEMQFAQFMQQQGMEPEQIQQAIVMTRAGAPPEQVIQALQQGAR